jgi:hypothetical protein
MDLSSPTARLCMAGTQAEFQRRVADARRLFSQAWDAAVDDYDRTMAAHYIAHLEPDPEQAHRWNLLALEHAHRDERTLGFMGSLLVSAGGTYESLGDVERAEQCFARAAELGVEHFRG